MVQVLRCASSFFKRYKVLRELSARSCYSATEQPSVNDLFERILQVKDEAHSNLLKLKDEHTSNLVAQILKLKDEAHSNLLKLKDESTAQILKVNNESKAELRNLAVRNVRLEFQVKAFNTKLLSAKGLLNMRGIIGAYSCLTASASSRRH